MIRYDIPLLPQRHQYILANRIFRAIKQFVICHKMLQYLRQIQEYLVDFLFHLKNIKLSMGKFRRRKKDGHKDARYILLQQKL